MNVGSLVFRTHAGVLVLALGIAMALSVVVGLGLARRRPQLAEVDSTMQAAVFGLVGLLLGFTFSMAGTRYDAQRRLIVEEANTIGTATLRADMYPEADRIGFRTDFREYLESRIADQEADADLSRIAAARERTAAAQKLLWARASRISQDSKFFVASAQMIPALNQMFDAAARRYAAERARVPESIVVLLFAMCISASFLYAYLAGRSRKFDRLTAITFVLLAAAVVYVTLELDRPRRGLINVSVSEQSLVEVRALF